jgi:hypothetical protein
MASKRLEHLLEGATLDPGLEPPVTRLVRRIAVRKILPRGARSQDPEDAVQHSAGIAPRPTAPIFPDAWLGKQRSDDFPLRLGQVHRPPSSSKETAAYLTCSSASVFAILRVHETRSTPPSSSCSSSGMPTTPSRTRSTITGRSTCTTRAATCTAPGATRCSPPGAWTMRP